MCSRLVGLLESFGFFIVLTWKNEYKWCQSAEEEYEKYLLYTLFSIQYKFSGAWLKSMFYSMCGSQMH